jgi:hypothetical protein
MSDGKTKTVVLCDCEGTMALDGPGLAEALRGVCP